jgi:hypothetical protein
MQVTGKNLSSRGDFIRGGCTCGRWWCGAGALVLDVVPSLQVRAAHSRSRRSKASAAAHAPAATAVLLPSRKKQTPSLAGY